MAEQVTINLRHVARGLDVPLRQVQAVVELLDEGNTVPFVTRYRKDQTGGLDEEQIRQIQARLAKMRLLAERKQTILRSIEVQGKLTEKLARQIQEASTTKRLEDLYLPFKPKKQTLATLARSRGLELLAGEILDAAPTCSDLDARAADFVNADRQVPTAADALLGAGHILAEQFSERADLRHQLREILQRSGRLVSVQIVTETRPSERPEPPPARPPSAPAQASPAMARASNGQPPDEDRPTGGQESSGSSAPRTGPLFQEVAGAVAATLEVIGQTQAAMAACASAPVSPLDPMSDVPAGPQAPTAVPADVQHSAPVNESEQRVAEALPGVCGSAAEMVVVAQTITVAEAAFAAEATTVAETRAATDTITVAETSAALPELDAAVARSNSPQAGQSAVQAGQAVRTPAPRQTKARQKLSKKELKKKKAEERKQHAFSDYFNYSEEVRKIPPHRILAINRGERAKVIRVRMECDLEAMYRVLDELCVPSAHPHADFLRGCARDALARLILPSLEREIRREMTERAEAHAVNVFARNLRNLLLQPPVRDRRVLAVDPGYKSGCKLVALDEFGKVLDHGVLYLIGKPERRQEAKQTVLEMIDKHQLSVVVIGNGTGCRETEDMFAEMIGNELKDKGVSYVIVNEAGASVYSTSRIGREEFPDCDASLRGAISIGRRLQDPLSELVKIDPASIGVGLYQHDVKAKHLRASLDDVVESCVNYVGVDVNTASPALLRYVSGLNQLTARRLYEHRLEHGPFRNREQLKEVPGLGEVTFVQAAGFLKIVGGENPLDATSIHPESYEITGRVMAKLQCTPADLAAKEAGQATGPMQRPDANALAAELQVGTLLLRDILAQLARPGRDPREDLPPPVFKRGILKLEDLTPGMELTGTVLNVVDFGAFIDIGMHDSGLVHVSQLADRFVRDPHEVIAVGDIVRVWVMEVDKQRRRVSLTMIPPGTQRAGHGRRPEASPARPAESAGPQKPREERRPRPPQGAPPPRPQGRPPARGHAPPPRPAFKPKSRPKPVIPITEEMKTGKSPMRAFSDLIQFFELKQQGPKTPPQAKPPEPRPPKPAPPEAAAPLPEVPQPLLPEAEPPQAALPEPAPPQPMLAEGKPPQDESHAAPDQTPGANPQPE